MMCPVCYTPEKLYAVLVTFFSTRRWLLYSHYHYFSQEYTAAFFVLLMKERFIWKLTKECKIKLVYGSQMVMT